MLTSSTRLPPTGAPARCTARRAAGPSARPLPRGARLAVRAAADEDEDFEARLASLRKKSRPDSAKAGAGSAPAPSAPARIASTPLDYENEVLHYESGPHPGDLLVNAALGTTLVWLPLTAASLGRAAFVRYRFTDRRLSVMTSAPWKTEQLDADYRDVTDVKTVGRGVGLWGDMVLTLTSGDKIELRALPQFTELRDYVLARREALGGNRSVSAAKADKMAERLERAAAAKGFGGEK